MSATDHQREFLSGGRSPAAKFRTMGTTINGRIIAQPHFQQQTDYVSKQPLTWPDGTSREQMLVELEDSDGTE
jgi:hypothetical protein